MPRALRSTVLHPNLRCSGLRPLLTPTQPSPVADPALDLLDPPPLTSAWPSSEGHPCPTRRHPTPALTLPRSHPPTPF